MTNSRAAERFLELEANANALVEQIQRLQKETEHYTQAASSLDTAGQRLGVLIEVLGKAGEALHETITGLMSLGLADMPDRLGKAEVSLDNTRHLLVDLAKSVSQSDQRAERLSAQMDALVDYQSRGLLGRMFGKVTNPGSATK